MEVGLRKFLNTYGFLLGIAGLIVLLDQISKEIVRNNLDFQEIWSPWHWLIPYARIVNWRNTGAAFGLFQNGNLIFIILAIIVSILIIYFFPRIPKEDWLMRLALSMQLGGAVGNLIDRLTQGYVTDYVSVGNFPVFNVADASISIGAALLVLSVWINDRKSDKTTTEKSMHTTNVTRPPSGQTSNTQPISEPLVPPHGEDVGDD